MIMDLGDGGHTQACVVKRVSDILGYGAASLHAKQADNRGQAVLDAMAHLSRQQSLVLECLLELGVRLLTLNGYAQQSRKAGEKIGIGLTELAGVRAIHFQHTKEGLAVSALFYQHVDRAPDPMFRQQLRRPEAGFRLQVVRDNCSSRLE